MDEGSSQQVSDNSDSGRVLRSGAIYPRESPSTPKSSKGQTNLVSPALAALEETRKRVDSIYKTIITAAETRRQIFGEKFGQSASTAVMTTPQKDASKMDNSVGMDMTTVIIDNIMKVIPVFTGEPANKVETDLHIFLNISQAYFKTLASADQLTFLSLVPKLKLRGVPYEICNNKTFTSFEEFQLVLSEYYFPAKDLSGLTHEMQSCRQLNGETARQFGQRVDCKLKECELFLHRLCKENAQPVLEEYERIAVQTFRRGLLSPSLKQYSCMLNETKFSNIIKKVSEMEILENQCQTPYNLIGQYQIPSYVKPIPVESVINSRPVTQHLVRNVPQTQSIWQRPVAGSPRKQITCYRCGQPDHISRDCRVRDVYCRNCRSKNHDSRVCPKANRAEVRHAQVRINCEFCQRYGHGVEECAAKRRWETRNSEGTHQGNGRLPVDERSDRH